MPCSAIYVQVFAHMCIWWFCVSVSCFVVVSRRTMKMIRRPAKIWDSAFRVMNLCFVIVSLLRWGEGLTWQGKPCSFSVKVPWNDFLKFPQSSFFLEFSLVLLDLNFHRFDTANSQQSAQHPQTRSARHQSPQSKKIMKQIEWKTVGTVETQEGRAESGDVCLSSTNEKMKK